MKPTLLILAAGMGSRYGGLKQVDQFGPSGETILDYSIYDAIRAGFGKVVFIIRKAIEAEFKAKFEGRFDDQIPVEYVYQEMDVLPEGFTAPADRTKPWGTTHAVWVAAPKIKEPFAVINGDDFYGEQSYREMADFLRGKADDENYCLLGFKLANTLSENGTVSRGVSEVDDQGLLKKVVERTQISRQSDGSVAHQEPDGSLVPLRDDDVVSMNMWGFTPSIFEHCGRIFREFLQTNSTHPKAESLLPTTVDQLVRSGKVKVHVLTSPEQWFGVTYPEDKPVVIQKLRELVKSGVYPDNLWSQRVVFPAARHTAPD